MPVATIQAGTAYYIAPDYLGAPHQITDPSQKVVWFWDHDPFGATAPTGTLTYALRFPGQFYDPLTGLNYNGFRDYDPATGRYIESDPIGLAGGVNTYGYVGGNPMSLTDGFGLRPYEDPMLTIADSIAGVGQTVPQTVPMTFPSPNMTYKWLGSIAGTGAAAFSIIGQEEVAGPLYLLAIAMKGEEISTSERPTGAAFGATAAMCTEQAFNAFGPQGQTAGFILGQVFENNIDLYSEAFGTPLYTPVER